MSHSQWTEAEDRARRGRRLITERRWGEAAAELRAAVEINPANPDWHFHLGRSLDELGRHDDAIDCYTQVLNLDPENLHALNHMGVSLHQLGRIADAMTVFQRLEKTDASYEPSYCNRILLYCELGDHQAAEEMFYTARLYRDHCPTCYYNIGLSLAARGLYERAVFCWQKTIDLAGDDVRVRAKIAETLSKRGLVEQARRHYIEGLKCDPDHIPTLLDYVGLLIQTDRLDEAAAKLCHAQKISATDASVTFTQARLDLARQCPDRAQIALRQTLHLDPTFSGANLLLARLAQDQGDLIRAKSHLRAELMLQPQSPQVLLDLSNMLIDVGELRLGIACLRRLTLAEPGNVRGWQNLAVAECLRGRLKRGIAASVHAMQLDPDNLAIRHNLALAYLQAGELVHAWEEVRHAIKRAPGNRLLRRLQFRIRITRWWRGLRRR